ncbi:MAG: Uncharacterized protein G01um101416_1222 [Microgenomates group bacterium Gr01-1014_16]|nr:MAG: Uncharacterized protein G01um101416_1222 [Microgenomates group bacterium Gr01-1014_16]
MTGTDTNVAPIRNLAEVRADMAQLTTRYDPNILLKKIGNKPGFPEEGTQLGGKDDLFKISTLYEFDNGILMTVSVADYYNTFGIELMRSLIGEYECRTASEKATAELAAINYIRTLDIQRKITMYLSKGEVSEIGVKYLAVMSKELDRANRHYLTAVQALRTLKQPPMQLNIRAETAVVGQNQIVQTNQ